MNKLILINGTICSGKSQLVDRLKDRLGQLDFYSIDHYRIKYNQDQTFAGETLAWEKLKQDILLQPRTAVLESSGISKHLRNLILLKNIMMILIPCPIHICYNRLKERGMTVPFPYKNIDPYKSILYITNKLEKMDHHLVSNDVNIIYEKILSFT